MRTALALFALLATAVAQEHAPTPEQCRADYLLWMPRQQTNVLVEGGYDTVFKDVSWKELINRAVVMGQCVTTDPEGMRGFDAKHSHLGGNAPVNYAEFASSLGTAASLREHHFLIRHHLMDQFVKEDEAGKRSE